MYDPNWRKCILCGDSKEIIKRIPDNSIDFIFTDPPYNIGKHSTGNIPLPGRSPMNNDVAEWDWTDFNPEDWAEDFIRILKPTGNLFIFTSYNQLGRWYNCLDNRFDTTNFMIWHKTNPAPKIFKAGFLNSCEMIFTCWNKGHTWNFLSQKEMHNFYESPICMRPERLSSPKHLAQKPVTLLKKIITIATNKNDIIFDPFMGVGSSGVAAIDMGRRYIGIEINREYFNAAKARIEKAMRNIDNTTGNDKPSVSEPLLIRQYQDRNKAGLEDLAILDKLSHGLKRQAKKETLNAQGAKKQPILKWAGGKEKELKYILPNMPHGIKRYFEPFVGGGSVFMSVLAETFYINDLSSELICLYKCIAGNDTRFLNLIRQINRSWQKAKSFYLDNKALNEIYISYRDNKINDSGLKSAIGTFCKQKETDITALVPVDFAFDTGILIDEMQKNLLRKMKRMKVLEFSKQCLPEKDLCDNIETAIKGSLYMYFRRLYNDKKISEDDEILHCSLFYFIRNYCYSGMFRYNDNGEFNVPYGGIAYNSKTLDKKIDYYLSETLSRHFADTIIENLDFEVFLRKYRPTEDDFVFLDPPYDSEFSTYAQNEFTGKDQARLADFMINECKAKWMLVIKNTDLIYSLYNKEGIKIRSFDKEYTVSFMNRNDKKAKHLLITNY